MLQYIYDVWSLVKRKGSIEVSESLNLGHVEFTVMKEGQHRRSL